MTVSIKLYDLQSNLLADLSPIAFERTLRVRHNMPRSFTFRARAGDALLADLRRGATKIVVKEDSDVLFHGRAWIVERTGDGTDNWATITAFDPWMELGFDADDRAGRPVRALKAAGGFINPTFNGGAEVSGPDLIYQVLTNSQQTGDESDATPGEGPLPILVDVDNFDIDVPPALDLNPTHIMSWPILIGDFVTQLVDTGVVDVRMRPLDIGESGDDFHMVEIEARSKIGTDRHATVHFDYWTGSKNATECRHVEDFSTVCNKLYDYLGPPSSAGERFPAGNITPTLASPTLSDAIDASRDLYGVFMQIRLADTSSDDPDAARPLFEALWSAEQAYRVEPRDMLFLAPAAGAKGLFTAPQDFDVGDLVAVNVGGEFGLTLAETQRVYGYDKTWDDLGVAQLSSLLVSADPAAAA